MSKIKLEPNASGTGTLTISAPNTNTDRTINLPDNAGDIITTGSVSETTKVPMFQVKLSAAQNMSDAVNTVIAFDSVEFDTHSGWDSTNYRYVAPIAGYYWISLGVSFDVVSGYIQGLVTLSLRFNGDTANLGSGRVLLRNGTDNNEHEAGSGASWLVYFNGTSDYIDTQSYLDGDGTRRMLGSGTYKNTWLCGYLVRSGAAL